MSCTRYVYPSLTEIEGCFENGKNIRYGKLRIDLEDHTYDGLTQTEFLAEISHNASKRCKDFKFDSNFYACVHQDTCSTCIIFDNRCENLSADIIDTQIKNTINDNILPIQEVTIIRDAAYERNKKVRPIKKENFHSYCPYYKILYKTCSYLDRNVNQCDNCRCIYTYQDLNYQYNLLTTNHFIQAQGEYHELLFKFICIVYLYVRTMNDTKSVLDEHKKLLLNTYTKLEHKNQIFFNISKSEKMHKSRYMAIVRNLSNEQLSEIVDSDSPNILDFVQE